VREIGRDTFLTKGTMGSFHDADECVRDLRLDFQLDRLR